MYQKADNQLRASYFPDGQKVQRISTNGKYGSKTSWYSLEIVKKEESLDKFQMFAQKIKSSHNNNKYQSYAQKFMKFSIKMETLENIFNYFKYYKK